MKKGEGLNWEKEKNNNLEVQGVMTTKKLIEEQHKCEHCLYLLSKDKSTKHGETHVKYICMLRTCVKEKVGDGDG